MIPIGGHRPHGGSTIPGRTSGPGLHKKAVGMTWDTSQETVLYALCFSSPLKFLPWLPPWWSVTLSVSSRNKPFPPQLAFGHGAYHSNSNPNEYSFLQTSIVSRPYCVTVLNTALVRPCSWSPQSCVVCLLGWRHTCATECIWMSEMSYRSQFSPPALVLGS